MLGSPIINSILLNATIWRRINRFGFKHNLSEESQGFRPGIRFIIHRHVL